MTDNPSFPVSESEYGQRVATYFGGLLAPAKPITRVGDTSMITLLRRNNLGALAQLIADDQSIPATPSGPVAEWEAMTLTGQWPR